MQLDRKQKAGTRGSHDGFVLESKRVAVALVFALGLLSSPALAQQPLPLQLESVFIGPLSGSEVLYRIDLDNIPTRPALIVEATPNVSYEDIQLEIRLEGWSGATGGSGACPDSSAFSEETTPSGPVRLVYPLYDCDPDADTFNSAEVDVIVRVLDYGSSSVPVKVDISVHGITQVPTNTLFFEVETDLSQQTVAMYPSKDTTLYRSNFTGSNGLGTRLWAGAEVEFVGGGQFGFWSRRPLRPLLAFDLLDEIPFTAQIDDADLRLYSSSVLGGGGGVSLYKVAPSPTGVTWQEGNATAPGSQFSGASSSITDANWFERRSGTDDWATAGGDIEGSSLGFLSVNSGGSSHTFSSSQLDAAVQTMIDTGNDDDGFLMTGPGTSPIFDFSDRGVSFYSDNALFIFQRPSLVVTYTPSEAWSEGIVNADTVSFVDEGDNFRWIYDDDKDNLLTTEIGGVCEILFYAPGQQNYFPYTYSYGGPTYTGLDCCTWQIDSDVSGTIGTGQAIFFHNLNASDPANYPPDTDGDGIADLCDNCVAQANGPTVGTCVNGTSIGGTCNSDLDCSAGEVCNQSQQDADLDGYGNACPVPEPGFAGGLMAAGALLAALSRGRRSRTVRGERRGERS